MKTNTKYLLVAAMAAVLTACGGGGGGTDTPVAPAPTPTPPAGTNSNYIPLVTSVPAPTYPAGSKELAEFNFLNKQRSQCGFGLLAQNAALDTAAKNHMLYMSNYADQIGALGLSFHGEYTQFPNGFTGADVNKRALYAGYGTATSPVTEAMVIGGDLVASARGDLAAPYHAKGLLSGLRDIGIAMSGLIVNSNTVFDMGSVTTKMQRSNVEVLTFPCEGATEVAAGLGGETPKPYAPRNLATNPVGTVLQFFGYDHGNFVATATKKSFIQVNNLVVTEVLTGVSVPMLPVQTMDNDPNPSVSDSGFAYAAPDQPLKYSTQYRVQATVVSSGVTVPIDYKFTTEDLCKDAFGNRLQCPYK